MIRGLYTAGTGLTNAARNIEVAGNNVTNCDTVGYKKDEAVSVSFNEYMNYSMANTGSKEIGRIANGVELGQVYAVLEQGGLKQTGKDTDFAILGEGFFTLITPDGKNQLTRNGQFGVDESGYLTDDFGNIVLGEAGPINVGQSDFSVTATGEVQVNGENKGKLLITCPTDLNALTKEEGTLFSYVGNTKAFQGEIRQGVLENSNVEITDEMTDIMSYTRSFQSCSQMIKMIDKITEKNR